MILIGRYRSPFTRRVAVTMQWLGLAYEHRPITAWTHLSDVRSVNPVGRVPALVLDAGETLFDSHAILDYLDNLVGPERALVPPREPARREVQRIVGCAMGALEKVVAALYAQTMVPPEKIHAPWVQHNEDQARSAFAWLDNLESNDWLHGGVLTQADITTAVTVDFTRIVNPALIDAAAYPRLCAHAARCNALAAFSATYPGNAVDQANPSLPARA
jgi:glutathione S-transferase